MNDRLINEVRTAYADAGLQRDDLQFDHDDRCLGFLTSDWLTPEEAKEAVKYIGPYNTFDPETTREIIDAITEEDPNALFAIGREGSPAIYVETDHLESVEAVFKRRWVNEDADSPWQRAGPDELSIVDPEAVGSARKYRNNDYGMVAHSTCSHDEPPVAPGDEAEPDPERSHVRAWWD